MSNILSVQENTTLRGAILPCTIFITVCSFCMGKSMDCTMKAQRETDVRLRFGYPSKKSERISSSHSLCHNVIMLISPEKLLQ